MSVEMDDAAIVYDVRVKSPGEHIFAVTCRINTPDPDGQLFSLP